MSTITNSRQLRRHVFANGDTIDFTKFKIGTRADRALIRACPKCGLPGEYYEDKDPRPKTGKRLWSATHRKTLVSRGPFPFWMVGSDHCGGVLD